VMYSGNADGTAQTFGQETGFADVDCEMMRLIVPYWAKQVPDLNLFRLKQVPVFGNKWQ